MDGPRDKDENDWRPPVAASNAAYIATFLANVNSRLRSLYVVVRPARLPYRIASSPPNKG